MAWPRGLAALAAGVLATILSPSSGHAAASNKIGTASFLTPAAADTYYGSGTTSTASITSVRADELKELARALKNDPDLIYEHVRNNMTTVWTYGLTKGGVGVTIDRSGTAFDQAHLMVELLREAGFTAAYKVGTITLSGAQFEAWTGVTSATAACQLLSSGGIPGAINGSTSATCAYGAATITTIEVGHVWVDVTIGGTHYVFDAAYKPHTFKAGVNLNTAASFTPGQPNMQSSPLYSGTTSGVPWVQRLWTGGVGNVVSNHATALNSAVTASSTLADLIGGQSIDAATIPIGGVRQTTLPYTSNALRTYTGGVPNQYRTVLTVQITKLRPDTSTPTVINTGSLYADELYGRRLIFDTNFDPSGASFTGALKLLGELGAGPTIGSTTYADDPRYSKGVVTLGLNMPYAASSGAYMDTTFSRPVSFALPFTIVHGYGDIGRGLIDKWGQRQDTPMPAAPAACDVCQPHYKATKGDGRRELLAASWLAQASRAARINAQVGKGIWAHHYSLGVVAADSTIYAHGSGPVTYAVTDSFDRVDVETGYSLTSKTASVTDRRAAVHTAAAAIDALKGGVVSQVADLPDTTSVATMLEWGNLPPVAEDGAGGLARSMFHFTTTTQAAQAASLALAENQTSTTNAATHGGGEPSIGDTEVQQRRTALANTISSYVASGFKVTASQDAFLGPGQRGGGYKNLGGGVYSHDPSRQRGGAMVATLYDVNGDPTEIAHVVVGPDGPIAGGGAGAQTYIQAQYDAPMAADVLKGRYVNGRPGAVAVASPAVVRSGVLGFPQGLTGELTWRGGDVEDATSVSPTRPRGPWTSNWDSEVLVGSSGLEAMGESDTRGALTTVAAFLVAQDLYKSAASAQRDAAAEMVMSVWIKQMSGNVATVAVGPQTRQFLKPTAAVTWVMPGAGAYAGLTQLSTVRVVSVGHPSCVTGGVAYSATRGYLPQGSGNYRVTGTRGDVQIFNNWVHDYKDSVSSQFCTRQKGFRLTNWNWFTVGTTLSYSTPTYAPPALTAVGNALGRGIVFNGATITNGLGGANLRQVTTAVAVISGGVRYDHTDPANGVTQFETAQLGQGYYQRHVLSKVYAADNASTPSTEMIYDALGRVKEVKDRLAQQGPGVRSPTIRYRADGVRSETVDPLGNRTVVYNDEPLQRIRTVSPVGTVSAAYYDGRGRVTRVINPEGDEVRYEYDDHNDVTKTTQVAKPGSPEAASNIVTEASYELVGHNPVWTKDAKGAQTDYVVGPSGLVTSSTAPAAQVGEDRPVTEFTYGAYMLPTRVKDWWGRIADVFYNTDGSISQTYIVDQRTYYTNNFDGQPTSIDGPRTDVTDVWTVQYDALGRETLRIEPAVAPNPSNATKTTYDPVGRVTKVEQGTYSGTTFTPLETVTTDYDTVGNKIRITTPAGVTQMTYDAANRVVCTAVRMNPAVYGALPADACSPSTVGSNGPDRITRNTYDAAGRVSQVEVGVGVAGQPPVRQVRYVYTANGKMALLDDANDNRSGFAYDGFDRLQRIYFPVSTRGALSANGGDYEAYTYDVNGNRTSVRKRSGAVINYQYDALNRLTLKDLPDGTAEDVIYAYANAGGPLTGLAFGAGGGSGITYTYDVMGRPSESGIANQYDTAGNLSYTTANNLRRKFTYDTLNRLTKIEAALSPYSTYIDVASYTYGALNRRSGVVRPNGANTTYTYDAAGRLANLTHVGVPSSTGTVQTFGYNPASQTISNGQSNSQYLWTGQPITTKNATHDGLNRDAAVVAASGYDANGNLTFDGVRTFTYDVENRLRTVTGAGTDLGLTYDPLGRLKKITSFGAQVSAFGYDGDRILYDGSKGYVHGLGVDEPLLAYSGSFTSLTYLHADRQGSIIGTSDSTGAVTPLTYGPYGEPQTWAGSRFRYTGQIAIPEAQLYYYKARMYDPMMGRFLQTDPIGYDDGPNIYAYVGGDPVNKTDPTGLCESAGTTTCGTWVDEVVVEGEIIESEGGIDAIQYELARLEADAIRTSRSNQNQRGNQPGCRALAGAATVALPSGGTGVGAGVARGLGVGILRMLGLLGTVLSLSGDTPQPTIPIYRVVGPAEFAQISATNQFSPSPSGFGEKQFWLNPEDAQWYAESVLARGWESSVTIVQTSVTRSTLSEAHPFTDAGHPAVSFSAESLPRLNADAARSGVRAVQSCGGK